MATSLLEDIGLEKETYRKFLHDAVDRVTDKICKDAQTRAEEGNTRDEVLGYVRGQFQTVLELIQINYNKYEDVSCGPNFQQSQESKSQGEDEDEACLEKGKKEFHKTMEEENQAEAAPQDNIPILPQGVASSTAKAPSLPAAKTPPVAAASTPPPPVKEESPEQFQKVPGQSVQVPSPTTKETSPNGEEEKQISDETGKDDEGHRGLLQQPQGASLLSYQAYGSALNEARGPVGTNGRSVSPHQNIPQGGSFYQQPGQNMRPQQSQQGPGQQYYLSAQAPTVMHPRQPLPQQAAPNLVYLQQPSYGQPNNMVITPNIQQFARRVYAYPPNSTYSPQSVVYFQNGGSWRPPRMPPTATQNVRPQQRKRKVLNITDPNTGKDITDEILKERPHSAESEDHDDSTSENQEICKPFTRLVADRLKMPDDSSNFGVSADQGAVGGTSSAAPFSQYQQPPPQQQPVSNTTSRNTNTGPLDFPPSFFQPEKHRAPSQPPSDKAMNKAKKDGRDKIQYDRAYLIQLRASASSQTKPEGLPNLEIILDRPVSNTSRNTNTGPLDFTPSFFQAGKHRAPSQPPLDKAMNKAKKDGRDMIQYDRANLIQLRACASSQTKPEGLPNLEIILDRPVSNTSRNTNTGPLDFTPSFFQAGKHRAPSQPPADKAMNKAKKDGRDKIQYDRAYLIQLRACASSQTKPEGLPNLEIILDRPVSNTSRNTNTGPLDFTPSFFQAGNNQRMGKSSDVTPLHQSEKPWKPARKHQTAGEAAEKNVVDENNIQFGPGGGMNKFSMWSRGSFGGAQPTQDDRQAPANRFSVGASSSGQVKKLKPMTEEGMEHKAKTILEEYLNIRDLEKAKLCMMELEGQEYIHAFVSASLNDILERSTKDRELTGQFFSEMVNNKLLSLDKYLQGLSDVLQNAEDMVIDIPKMWSCLAQMISPMLLGGALTLARLQASFKPNLADKCCAKLLAEILLIIKEQASESEAAQMWQSSGCKWSDYLSVVEVNDFINNKKLGYLENPVMASSGAPRSGHQDLDRLTDDIEKLVRDNSPNSQIFAYIDKHVPGDKQEKTFIRALMTAVAKSSISDKMKANEEVIKARKDVLHRYLKNTPELELQALYAIQALMHKLEHPSGVIVSLFDTLYDEEVITEDAFKKWEKSSDPQELEGKGHCSLQLAQFFTWLTENEEPETSS